MTEVIDSRDSVLENLARIRVGIERACERSGREPTGIRLVAITKTVSPEAVRWAAEAGVQDFGENYVNELATKKEASEDATWHFVGVLQSHTAHRVADLADVVHTLSSGRAPMRLSRRAASRGRRLPGMIEVDFTGNRSGADPGSVPAFADEVVGMEGLELAGLMTLPPLPGAAEESRPYFRKLRELRDTLLERHPHANELSMGMSIDYEVAVEEGATMVRIGTALFGDRTSAR